MKNSSSGLILFTGAPTTGKNTILNKVIEDFRKELFFIKRLLVDTTRPQRKGENEGQEYYFIAEDVYTDNFSNGQYYGNERTNSFNGFHYGTPKKRCKEMISSLCIGIPTCVSVTKELLIDALHYHKNIKRIHLIADEQTRIKRLQERGTVPKEMFVRLAIGDSHNIEPDANINLDTGKISLNDIVTLISKEIIELI